METFGIAVTQVAMLFVLIAIGFFLCKKEVLNDTVRQGVTTILLDIVTPCVIISEMQAKRTHARMIGLAVAAGVYALYLVAAILLSRFLTIRQDNRATNRICMVYTNCGFMGLPLLAALDELVGGDALFYGSVIIAVNNLFIFTQGIAMFGEKSGFKGLLKRVLSPAVFSVFVGAALFFAGWTLPGVIGKPIEYLASMNTPLAMLMIGAILCRSDIRRVFLDSRVFFPAAARNLLFPLLFLGVIALAKRFFPLGDYAGQLMTCLIISACPVAGNAAIFSERYGGDSRLASGIFTLSTLFSALTIPMIVTIASGI